MTIPPLPSRYRYRFTDRTVTLYQSGAGSVRVRRNENLGDQRYWSCGTCIIRWSEAVAERVDQPLLRPGKYTGVRGALLFALLYIV